jgi:monothiol glutaredoxin
MCESVSYPFGSRNCWSVDDVKQAVVSQKVVMFAKGSSTAPNNGYSEQILSLLNSCQRPFKYIDVRTEKTILPALKAYSGSSQLPMLYVGGTLVSSSDVQVDLVLSGELKNRIEKEFEPSK